MLIHWWNLRNIATIIKKYQDVYGNMNQRWDEPALTDAGGVANFPCNNASFKFKQKK